MKPRFWGPLAPLTLGLAIIVYVAIEMIWRGWHQVAPFASSFASTLMKLRLTP